MDTMSLGSCSKFQGLLLFSVADITADFQKFWEVEVTAQKEHWEYKVKTKE